MSTDIRPEISKKNQYWISRHRYYELKHFCLQYPGWKKAYTTLHEYGRTSMPDVYIKNTNPADPTEELGCRLAYFSERMRIVEDAAARTDEFLSSYILKAVTEGLTYPYLQTRLNIPCGRDNYYILYRKFFWILHCARN